MSYKAFTSDFKNDILGSFLFFYGAEDFLMNWALDSIKKKYVDEEYRSFDIVELEGDDCDAGTIISAARSYSMFSSKRVVIVRNYLPLIKGGLGKDSGSKDEIIGLCKESNDSSIVIFVIESRFSQNITAFGKKLMKACNAYEFARLEKAELQGFISKRFRRAGLMIGRREMQYLIDLSGYYYKDSEYSLNDMERDLFKIVNACDGKAVDMKLIDELMVGADDKFVFNLVDAIVSENRGKAMEMMATILDDDDKAMMLLSLITKQFEIMYDSLELADEGASITAMAKTLSVNEFRLKKAYTAARRFQKSRIKNILIHLYNIDRDIKNGETDKNIALELFAATV